MNRRFLYLFALLIAATALVIILFPGTLLQILLRASPFVVLALFWTMPVIGVYFIVRSVKRHRAIRR